MNKKGILVIIDGIDGCGKGVVVKTLAGWAQKQGLKILDLRTFGQKKHTFPKPAEIKKYDVLLSAEPTFSMIGQAIREEIVRSNGRHYSAFTTAEAYALDREILYKRLIIPALKQGKIIFQERGVSTSLIYQPIQAEPLSLQKIMRLPGNQLTLKHRPDLLIIAQLKPRTAIQRLKVRHSKQDQAIFEKLNFLEKATKRFQAKWFREIFTKRGSHVAYFNTNSTISQTKKEALKIWEKFLKNIKT